MNITQFDRQFFDCIQQWNSPEADVLMAVLSSWVLWKPVAIVAALVAVIFGGFKGRAFLLCGTLIVLLADAGVANAIKQSTGRMRPYQATSGVRVVRLAKMSPRFLALTHPAVVELSSLPPRSQEGRSFPSGHTTNNFALAVVLMWFYRRWGWLYFVVAALVAWSRVYVGDHYPTDVLAAFAIGTLVGTLMMMLFEWLWRTYGLRLAPVTWKRNPALSGRVTTLSSS